MFGHDAFDADLAKLYAELVNDGCIGKDPAGSSSSASVVVPEADPANLIVAAPIASSAVPATTDLITMPAGDLQLDLSEFLIGFDDDETVADLPPLVASSPTTSAPTTPVVPAFTATALAPLYNLTSPVAFPIPVPTLPPQAPAPISQGAPVLPAAVAYPSTVPTTPATAVPAPLTPAATPAPVPAPIPAPTLIPTNTRKSTTKCKLLPAALAYPSHLIPLDAPIQPRRGVHPAPAAPAQKRAAEDDPASAQSEKELKRLKNTLSARMSRARKAAKIDLLESKVNELETENHRLERLVQDLQRQVLAYQEQQLQQLQAQAASGRSENGQLW
ncbi:hypothetical protein AMAG_15547 [Allomyces macrogynus ATCC 38327]|uniref:BZIP domain-containing protein n=2 Tax=Allomyces macrogynus (strain ATCC 38327) TaxID=578462 RepID=A0A0L0T918_ALLM3|nr:hypothetical protein AMAG_15547 [Allomyces macrogynus ATCC 38327]|eukprot:KNE71308.1 hypothetical protein AMAG_15547 [Allomyces macrogynus ATCC 38327]